MKKESLFLILVAIGLIPLGITYGAHPHSTFYQFHF